MKWSFMTNSRITRTGGAQERKGKKKGKGRGEEEEEEHKNKTESEREVHLSLSMCIHCACIEGHAAFIISIRGGLRDVGSSPPRRKSFLAEAETRVKGEKEEREKKHGLRVGGYREVGLAGLCLQGGKQRDARVSIGDRT